MALSRKNLDAYQVEIDKTKSIKFYDNIVIKSLGDLIYYSCHPMYNLTIYIDGKLHCMEGKRRTTKDIYLLSKYYQFNLSLREIDKILNKFNGLTKGALKVY